MKIRPNILYISSHDTGRYIQPFGHAVPTPNLHKLAESGVLREMRARLDRWMRQTDDPLLAGPITPPEM